MDCRLAKDCMVHLALRFPSLRPIKPAMDVIRPPGFHFHNHMSRQPFGTLQKEGAQDRHGHGKATLLAQRSGIFDRCKEFTRCATHLQNLHTMITIRSSAASSEPTLIGLEVILTTPHGTYMISSNGEAADFSSAFGGGLFSAISWPRSQFRLAPGIVLDQQLHSPGNYTLNRPYKRGSQSSRSFPVAVHARTATSVSTLTRRRTAGGLPGCQMCVDQRSSPIPMGGITMNQFGCSIAFASKRQPRLQRKT